MRLVLYADIAYHNTTKKVVTTYHLVKYGVNICLYSSTVLISVIFVENCVAHCALLLCCDVNNFKITALLKQS